jgi:hypothetical protein
VAHNGGSRSNGGGGASDRRKKMMPEWAGPEWPGGPNATWAGAERKQRKKQRWAARMTGPKWFCAALRKRKRFSDFDSRNSIQIYILNISKPNLNWIF